MNNIIFVSQKAKSYFANNQAQTNQIYDYFDIEAQKVLPFLKYNYKNQPIIIDAEYNCTVQNRHKKFDLDNYEILPDDAALDFDNSICVMYNCY